MGQIIDGKSIAESIKAEIKAEVDIIKAQGKKTPHLAAILIGNDGASETYVANKSKACAKVGFNFTLFRFSDSIKEENLLAKIHEINCDSEIDGLIIQLPLPKHINEQIITQSVSPSKDVDGFHALNMGKVAQHIPSFISATPMGILLLIKKYAIETEGKHCVVIGRSNVVGSPMSILLSRNTYPGNCTVTLCHSKTQNLIEHTKRADILVAAIGKCEFITANMIKEGTVIIDVGIHRVPSNKTKSGYELKGDVKFDEVAPKASYITPVPGGVGSMTIVALLQNTLLAAKKEIYK